MLCADYGFTFIGKCSQLIVPFILRQADQSGTIAEILVEDTKPVSVDTVSNLKTSHKYSRTFCLSKKFFCFCTASFCHSTLRASSKVRKNFFEAFGDKITFRTFIFSCNLNNVCFSFWKNRRNSQFFEF